jgi:serine-type D-Ala-D-Ala carboxypeptidase (penicillin-binding protein 5/6)
LRKRISALLAAVLIVFSFPAAASAAQAYAVIDAETGRLLKGVNEDARLPIASLTKIWTALTYIDASGTDGTVTVSKNATNQEGSSIYLRAGEEVPAEKLLYGLMLRSGNDAATALAEDAGGSIEGFVDMMNEKARLAGLKNTVFTNPSGLHDDRHLSTAYETALMLKHATDNDRLKEISSTVLYKYEDGGWQNKHRLVRAEGDAVAGKTGFTKTAGRTLATLFEKDGKRVIVVTLNDGDDWNTHRNLSGEAFRTYKKVIVAEEGTYQILPGIRGELEEPLAVLLSEKEIQDVSHAAIIPRGAGNGIWQVRLDGVPIATAKLKIKKR